MADGQPLLQKKARMRQKEVTVERKRRAREAAQQEAPSRCSTTLLLDCCPMQSNHLGSIAEGSVDCTVYCSTAE